MDRRRTQAHGTRTDFSSWHGPSRLAEKKARELGYEEITEEVLERFKEQMMGGMGGEAGMTAAAEAMEQGRLPWTAAAKERLATVPEFMQAMIKQIAEEIAKERGHLEVNVELFEKVEALGDPLIEFGFGIGLARIHAISDARNQRALRFAERLGLQREGTLRCWERDPQGSLADVVILAAYNPRAL